MHLLIKMTSSLGAALLMIHVLIAPTVTAQSQSPGQALSATMGKFTPCGQACFAANGYSFKTSFTDDEAVLFCNKWQGSAKSAVQDCCFNCPLGNPDFGNSIDVTLTNSSTTTSGSIALRNTRGANTIAIATSCGIDIFADSSISLCCAVAFFRHFKFGTSCFAGCIHQVKHDYDQTNQHQCCSSYAHVGHNLASDDVFQIFQIQQFHPCWQFSYPISF
ncbi:hypothetical protein HDU96_010796 [Phlyctochytrium bullatum]|nr:hypothetical protein HDU96_010796 [Phlyctochytrium bullatum]